MTRRDIYHETVKQALLHDGWTITHDPFRIRVGRKRLAIDLGAERLLSAAKGLRQIVVEVKSFVSLSEVKDLEQALGQYILYQQALREYNVARELYLAVPKRVYHTLFEERLGAMLLTNGIVQLLVFDERSEVIVKWLPN